MAKVRFELDTAGVGAFLKSSEMMQVAKGYADDIASRAGDGFETKTFAGFDRAHAVVYPATKEANDRNLKENTILKAR